jgi:hypothetical protein
MGQHKHNPTAIAVKEGRLSRSKRVKRHTSAGYTGTSRNVLDIRDALGKPVYVQAGPCIRRRYQKVRGKANVKASKRARIQARESAARPANAA